MGCTKFKVGVGQNTGVGRQTVTFFLCKKEPHSLVVLFTFKSRGYQNYCEIGICKLNAVALVGEGLTHILPVFNLQPVYIASGSGNYVYFRTGGPCAWNIYPLHFQIF